MGNNQSEREYEEIRLKQTISLAEEQLKQAKEAAEKKKSQIIEAKKEVRENATHSVTNLYTSDGFEALVELSQYMNPVTDKIVDYEEEEHRILLLENMIKSPYFARIDFKFDDEEECEKIYIGRSSLRKNSYQEMYVYDWRSPIASIFYRFMKGEAFYDAPCGRVTGELKLKRQYEIKNGVLKYFFDTDVQIVDEFLRQLIFGTGKGRGHKAEKNLVKQEIQKFIKIDIFELYKTLFSNESYFFSLLQNNNSSESIKEIREYTKENLEAGCIYYDDAIAMLYLYLKIYGTNEYKNIKQVVIDEAQDYYPLQYEIFGLLFPNAKFTILGDMKQTLAKKEDISFYEEIHKILNKKKSSLIVLNKSFRCTNEILNFSLKFIEQSPQIKSFNRKGDSPEVFIADNSEVFIDKIVEEVKSCQEKGLQSIGLICKTENNSICLYNKIKHKLDIQIIRNGSAAELQGVFIIPVYMSKGLEFDAVLICDADNQNYYDEDDKNLLYVACTRALHRLSLFCEKEVSPLIYATSKHTKLAQTE